MNTHYYFLALAPSTSPHFSTTFFFVVLSRSAPLLPRHRIREQTIAKVKNNFRSTSTFNPIFFSDKKKQNIFPRAGWLDERWQYKNKQQHNLGHNLPNVGPSAILTCITFQCFFIYTKVCIKRIKLLKNIASEAMSTFTQFLHNDIIFLSQNIKNIFL